MLFVAAVRWPSRTGFSLDDASKYNFTGRQVDEELIPAMPTPAKKGGIKAGAGRPKGSTAYVAHNALAKAFWARHINWKDEVAKLYLEFRETGDARYINVWLILLPYLALTEKARADKGLGKIHGKKHKISHKALAALKRLEEKAAQPRPLTLGEQKQYGADA